MLRAAGRTAFVLTVLGDLAKGAVATLLARLLFGELAQLVAGFCAVLGNNWSIFLRSRGGAGVMTTVGTLLVIAPLVVLSVGWLPVLLVYVTRISSIGSLVAAIARDVERLAPNALFVNFTNPEGRICTAFRRHPKRYKRS